jgi:CheY-like chemotaxis protein
MNPSEGSFKILLIEDNHGLAEMLCMIMNQMGHEAIAVYDGVDGLKKSKEILPDIILCDIGLPGMNGYEVAKNIRSDPSLKDTALVALTGYAGDNDKILAYESGFNLYMAKPVNNDRLKRMLADVAAKNYYKR